ncbi:IS200/IS605 family accessory protein TnpB-related protein, partial [Kitasatospora aureofaciens]
RALGHPIRRRTTPPRRHQSDAGGHRTAQAGPGTRGREETRRPVTDRSPELRARTGTTQGTRATSAPKTVRDARSDRQWVQDSLLLTE